MKADQPGAICNAAPSAAIDSSSPSILTLLSLALVRSLNQRLAIVIILLTVSAVYLVRIHQISNHSGQKHGSA
jgi:hypothetical protein